MTALPPMAELVAPANWERIEFISDLHLQASEPATFSAFSTYLRDTAAQAVFILGDLFEVWVGDDAGLDTADAASVFERECMAALKAASVRCDIHFLHGNRDFLLGDAMAIACGMRLLADPTILVWRGRRILLTHGDALCLADVDYLAFRAQVRTAGWRETFLAKPLAERRAVAADMRARSREAQKDRAANGQTWADVDELEAVRWLAAARGDTLIHGHTHRPGRHAMSGRTERVVLSDWEPAATPPRADAWRLDPSGLRRVILV